ncbi:GNAT family N-acetyltransferase [candidate division WOR-3 bacterium]|nr:GNAT family N-acetyltransferase [candidate division WOR-3 bacterium]
MNIVFRKYEDSDHENLVKLWEKSGLPYKLSGRDGKSLTLKQSLLENVCYYLAEIDGKVVGSVFATHDGRKGWVNRLAVDPDFGGKGIAGLLVEKAEEWFRSKSIKVYACLINEENERSKRVFEKMGYSLKDHIKYFVKKPAGDV